MIWELLGERGRLSSILSLESRGRGSLTEPMVVEDWMFELPVQHKANSRSSAPLAIDTMGSSSAIECYRDSKVVDEDVKKLWRMKKNDTHWSLQIR